MEYSYTASNSDYAINHWYKYAAEILDFSKTDPTSLPEGQRKITIPVGQALNIMQNSIMELKNKESSEDNSFFMNELSIVNEKIVEIVDENTSLKKEIESLKKTITDIQTLSNAMNTKLMTL